MLFQPVPVVVEYFLHYEVFNVRKRSHFVKDNNMRLNSMEKYTYYEQPAIWEEPISELEKDRIASIINLVPHDANLIADLGCGSGRIANEIDHERTVVGLDMSTEALKHCRVQVVRASIAQTPFPDSVFDCIILSDVLEHLENSSHKKALKEVRRLAKKYVIVSTPNKENLKQRLCKCPRCGVCFHAYHHKRSYTPKSLERHLEGFRIQTIMKLGREILKHPIILYLMHSMGHYWYFKYAVCPSCNLKFSEIDQPSLPITKKPVISALYITNSILSMIKKWMGMFNPVEMVVLLRRVDCSQSSNSAK